MHIEDAIRQDMRKRGCKYGCYVNIAADDEGNFHVSARISKIPITEELIKEMRNEPIPEGYHRIEGQPNFVELEDMMSVTAQKVIETGLEGLRNSNSKLGRRLKFGCGFALNEAEDGCFVQNTFSASPITEKKVDELRESILRQHRPKSLEGPIFFELDDQEFKKLAAASGGCLLPTIGLFMSFVLAITCFV